MNPWRRIVPGRAFLLVALGGYGPGLVAFHALAPRPDAPAGAAFRLAALQAVILLAWAPALARAEWRSDPRAWTRLGILTAVGAVVFAIAELPRGRVPGAEIAVLAGFSAALLGLRDVLRGLGLGERPARLAPLLLGALALTTLAWSGPVIELGDEPGRGVDLAIRANPLAAIAGGALEIDWARLRPVTYDAFVGQYYPFSYPGALGASFGWLALGAALGGTGIAMARRRPEPRVE